MCTGALEQCHALALEFGHVLHGTGLGHQHCFGLALVGLDGKILQVDPGCLGEDRRDIANIADVQAAGVERFDQRRATEKFGPLHLGARQCGFEELVLTGEHHADRAFLVADAQRGRFGRRGGLRQYCQCQQRTAQQVSDCFHKLPLGGSIRFKVSTGSVGAGLPAMAA